MSAHTPGPWQWYWRLGENLKADCGVFSETRPGHAYSVCRAPQYEGQAQWEANARLIAAAPELLEACQTVLAGIERGLPIDANTVNGLVVARLRAAIAKAEGRA